VLAFGLPDLSPSGIWGSMDSRPVRRRFVPMVIATSALVLGGALGGVLLWRSAHAAVSVKLLAAGLTPYRTLRLKLKKGARQKVVMTMHMQPEIRIGNRPAPKTVLPPMQTVMSITVTDVKPDGEARHEFEVTAAQVVEQPGTAEFLKGVLNKALAGTVGMKGYAVISDRGITREADLALPDTLDQQQRQLMEGLRQSLDQLSFPLPEEPIGAGGSWRVAHELEMNGIRLSQTTEYTIVAFDGDRITIDVAVKQSAEPQKISPPGLPPGATIELRSLESEGSGRTILDLGQVGPPQAKLSMSSQSQMHFTGSGQEQDMHMNMKMTLELVSTPL